MLQFFDLIVLTFPDRPFLRPDAVTPDSNYSNYSDPRSLTPHTPSTQVTSPGSMMSRKPSPPSPEMRLPFDNPFPVFTSEKFSSPSTEKPKQAATPARTQPGIQDSVFTKRPMSPGAQVLKRMDTIAAGPFAGSLRSEVKDPAEPVGRRPSNGSAPKPFRNLEGREHFRRPSTSQSQRSEPSNPYELSSLSNRQPQNQPQSMQRGPSDPQRPGIAVDQMFAQLQNQNEPNPSQFMTPASRSKTLAEGSRLRQQDPTSAFGNEDPAIQSMQRPIGQRSYDQPLRSAGLERPNQNPYGYGQPEDQLSKPTFGNVRPRSRSFGSSANRFERRRPDQPPVPAIPGVSRQDSDKSMTSEVSHATSDSSSSGYSVASNAQSEVSSNTSWGDDDRSAVSRSRSDAGGLKGNRWDRSRNNQPFEDSKFSQSSKREPTLPVIDSLDSPVDPAIQYGIGGRQRTGTNTGTRRPSETSSESSPPRARDRSGSRESNGTTPQRSLTTRGACAACHKAIMVGEKSVKDSTGRLTGRYHKACFGCRTCGCAFPTGEFYVHAAAPYCARHWHEANGSLCRGCDAGIEGLYLETDRQEKFHQTCFKCTTCRARLDEEYFEFEGKPFCERHSWAFGPRNNGTLGVPGSGFGPGGRFGRSPEKRRTRLMNMM